MEFDFGFQYPNIKVKEEFLKEARLDREISKNSQQAKKEQDNFLHKHSLKLNLPGSEFTEAYN